MKSFGRSAWRSIAQTRVFALPCAIVLASVSAASAQDTGSSAPGRSAAAASASEVREIVIVRGASRRPENIVDAPAAVSLVDPAELEREAPSGQLPRALAGTPGTEVVQADVYDFSFNIRGFNDMVNRRVLALIDGRDPSLPGVGSQEWAALSFPLDDIERLEVIRGAGSALYGPGAYNGVVNVTTRPPENDTAMVRMAAGDLATRRLDARITRELGNDWYLKATGGTSSGRDFTVSRAGSVEYAPGRLPMEAVDPPRDRVRIQYGGLRLDHASGQDGLLSLELGTARVAGTTTMTGLGRQQQTDSSRPWARVSYGTSRWNFLAWYTAQDSDNIVPLGAGTRQFLDTYNLAAELQGNGEFAGGRGRFVGGVSFGRERLDSASPAGAQTILAHRATQNRSGAFGQVDYDLTARLKGVLTARWDDSTGYDSRISPRVALVYAVNDAHSFRASYSKAFLRPSMIQQFLQSPAAAPIDLSALEAALAPALGGVELGFAAVPVLAVGNEALEVEEIATSEIGYRGYFDAGFSLTVSYFHNRLDNFTTDLLPQLGTSLGRINPAFGPYMPPAALSPDQAALVSGTLAVALPPELLATLSNTPDTAPAFVVVSLTNFGKVDTSGLELGLQKLLPHSLTFDLAYNYFDFDVLEAAPENPLAPNTPRHRVVASLTYSGERFTAALRTQWVDRFAWRSGFYVGDVPSYRVTDLSVLCDVNDSWTVGLDVANAFDEVHYEMFGGSLLRRRALLHATRRF